MVLITNNFSAIDSVVKMILTATKVCVVAIVTILVAPSGSTYVKSPVLMATSSPLPSKSPSLSSSRSFHEFNKIFENASILITEEFEVSEEVAFIDLNMNIRNIKCYDMFLGDISVDHEQQSDTAFIVSIDVTNLDLTCEMNYDYTYGILSGDGWVQIQTQGSDISSLISFASQDFDRNYPPTDSAIDSCSSDVVIKNMDFEEDFASEVLEVFQSLIRNTVETAIEDVACEELSVIGTTVVGNMIDIANDQLQPYIGYLGEDITDPLYLEKNLILPDTFEALNLQDTEGVIGTTFYEVLQFFDTHLGTSISDSSSTENDLMINSLLRSFFLSDDGSFTMTRTDISTMVNPILFEGHDRLTEFTVTLDEIRLYGLDSITRFNSFRNIGKYTLQNELTWDTLKFQFDMIVDIVPSTLDDAILTNPTSSGISEHFSIDFTVNNIDIEASLLLVLDELAMGSMELGSLFYTENLLPCLLSIVHEVKLSGLDVDPSYINDGPTVDSLLSSGLDHAITEAVEAAFTMYKGSLRAAIPNIFQTNVRNIINSFFFDFFVDNQTNMICPASKSVGEGYIDFREFFNAENGSYGDLPSAFKNILDEELLAINPETRTPRFNEAVIVPITGAQSGTKGTLMFPTDLFTLVMPDTESKKFGMETLELRFFDPKIENLDTIGMPLRLLEANATYGQVLDNYATLGYAERKFRIGLKGRFSVEGDAELTMTNEMDMSVELAGSNAWVSLMAKVDAEKLFNFPLKDITNLQCWLNTLSTPYTLSGTEEVGLSVLNALLTTSSTSFDLKCGTCTSSSLSVLPEILDSLESFGVSDVVSKRFVKLVVNLLSSDFSQEYINGILMDASIRCPHSPNFIGSRASFSDNASVAFPSLDYQSLETIVLVSVVATEVAAVVMAQSHESYDLESSFPLSGQNNLRLADGVQLVDFTSLETSLGKWTSFGVGDIIGFLNEVVIDPNGNYETGDLRVNSLVRSYILDEDGKYPMIFDGFDQEKAGFGISIKELKIAGLDTISELNAFDVIGAQTIQNGIAWKNIDIQLVLSLEDPNGLRANDITISAKLSDVKLSIAILMAIDLDLFESLEMKSIMHLKHVLPCMISATKDASFTELELSVGSIFDISFVGFDSTEIAASANESAKLILEKYIDKIVSAIPKVFDSTVRTLLNNWLRYHMDDSTSVHCKHLSSDGVSDSPFVDLRDLFWTADVANRLGGTGLSQYGDTFGMAMKFLQNILKTNETTGLSGFNEVVVNPLTKAKFNEAGTILYSGDLYTGMNRIKVGALDTNVSFRVHDAKIENLNTVGDPLELFGAIKGEAHMLNNTLTAGVGKSPLHLSSKLQLSLQGDGNTNINNEIDLSLELTDATVILSTLTKILEARLLSFPLRDAFDINCWLALIPAPSLDTQGVRESNSPLTAALAYLEADVGKLKVTANCTNCSSPKMIELTNLLSSPDARNETTDIANALLDYAAQLMGGNFLQVQIDRMLNEATRMCPHSPMYDPDAKYFVYEDFETPNTAYSMRYLVLLTALTLTVIMIMATIAITVKWIVRRRHRKWLIRLPPHQFKNLSYEQKSEQILEDKLNSSTRSMFRSPDVPCIIQFIVPVVIIGNLLFFLSGHLSLGATVNIEAEVAGEKLTVEKFFEFSMARSTIDIWKAGGHELAVLILVFSGIWPYTKLFITLWLWFASPLKISITRRGSILLWLDWLAKWSMVDIFVLVISIAAFRISIASPDTSYLPDDFYSIQMMVIPLWGLYANMTAQLISQITSHVIIYYHRKIVGRATDRLKEAVSPTLTEARGQDTQADDSNMVSIGQEQSSCTSSLEEISVGQSTYTLTKKSEKEDMSSLSTYQFGRPHRGDTEKLIVRSYVNKLLTLCAFLIVVCVITGCVLSSFSLELFGIIGVAVEYGQNFEEATVDHSVFSVIKLLFDQASYLGSTRDYIGLVVLSALFVLTILFVPIIQSVTLLRLWFSNSTAKQKQNTAVRLEILQAWQYLDVYLVALFISSWQLGPVSDFMINEYCKNLEDTFAQMVYFGLLKEEDAQCFGVISKIGQNAFVLLAGAVLLVFLSSFVCKAVVQHLRDQTRLGMELNWKDRRDTRVLDESSHSNNNDEVSDPVVTAGIRPVPVLFTDTFRWMLKSNDSTTSSTRTLSVDHNTSHWSLPQATVVSSDSLSPDRKITKGTYVRDLSPAGKTDIAESAPFSSAGKGNLEQTREGSIDLFSSVSFDSYKSSPGGRHNDGADEEGSYRFSPQARLKTERRESISSFRQHSINSKMDSVGSSSHGRNFESCPTDSSLSVESPPAEIVSARKSFLPSRKPPPPAAYRLSERSLKDSIPCQSPPTYVGYIPETRQSFKKPLPDSSSPSSSPWLMSGKEDYGHDSVKSEGSRRYSFINADEHSAVRYISDIINELDNGAGTDYEDQSFSSQSDRSMV